MKKVGTFDIETDGLLEDATRVWCGVVKDHAAGRREAFGPNDIGDLLNCLSSYDVLIGHNCIAFDFPVLRKLYGWEYKGTKVDTLIMSRTQRPLRKSPAGCDSGPHSVEAWGIRLGQSKVQNEVWSVYTSNILHRCEEDVEIQYRIYHTLLEEGRGEGWTRAHKLNFKLFDLLQRQEEYGWTIDQSLLHRNIKQLNRWIGRIDSVVSVSLPFICESLETKSLGEYGYIKKPFKKDGTYSNSVTAYFSDGADFIVGPFSRVTFRKVNLDSNKETKDFLIKQGWIPTEWNEDDAGNRRSPKFSKDDNFEGIKGGLGKLIAKRIQCRQRLGILEGWAEAIRPDGKIPTRVVGIATTGRLRHSLVVNVPSPHSKAFYAKQMRSIFVPRQGWLQVGVDSKGNQIRQLAARMGDDDFTKAVLFGKSEDGTDLHSLNQKRSGAESRSKAKNFFYGFIFGAGAKKISTTIGISLQQAKELIERYLSELPLLRKLINDLTTEWRQSAKKRFDEKTNRWIYFNGYITGLDGRPILVDSEHKILCYALQSDEAIQMAYAYVKFHELMAEHGYVLHKNWGMLIWMHDEFQFECEPEIAEVAARLGCEAIKWAGDYLGIKCPHDGDYKIGSSWYECH